MDRLKSIKTIRKKLKNNEVSIGSWMQIPHPSIAEIMGAAGYDWVAIDMEHASVSYHQLPDLFRSLELGNTLPLVRLSEGNKTSCKQVLDAGAGGVIVPMVESSSQLLSIKKACSWPPKGNRGVGFSRANLFGKNFNTYKIEAQSPILVAMIESVTAIKNLDDILSVDGLDAIMIGPYDLSASLKIIGKFNNIKFKSAIRYILTKAKKANIAAGLHVVEGSEKNLNIRIKEGYRFLAYSIDAVMLRKESDISLFNRKKK
jgi:2-dehydro-3-deoxyglucarate aldolase